MSHAKKLSLPPGPRSLVPGRVFLDLRRGPLAFLTRLVERYGAISSFRAAGQRYVVVSDPELAREVLMARAEEFWKGPALQNSKGILGEGLLTAEGEMHRQQRKLMQPSFHAKHVENYAGEVVRGTVEMMAAWRRKGGGEMEVRAEMMGLTLVIAGRALFGAVLEDEIAMMHRCMDDLMNNYVRAVLPWGRLLNYLPLPSTRKLARAQKELFGLVDRMIALRRKGIDQEKGRPGDKEKGRDLLSMMIAATDEAEGCPMGHGGGKATGPGAGSGRMTDRQLRDQAVTIITAGHETTANVMTFTLYLLAKHPAEQEKLRAEVREVLGERVVPEVRDLDRLVRTRWVLAESMRLFPPAWTMGRQSQKEMELGGYRVPAKSTVLIPQWTLQRDGKYFAEPLAFLPERWREPKHPRFAYLPFSTGPRNCIGESFAWLEMILALAMLVRGFEFRLGAGMEGEMKLTPAITLRPRGAVRLVVTPV